MPKSFNSLLIQRGKKENSNLREKLEQHENYITCFSCISYSFSCLIHIMLQMIWQSCLRGYTGEKGSREKRNITPSCSSSVIISQAVANTARGWWKTSRSLGSTERLKHHQELSPAAGEKPPVSPPSSTNILIDFIFYWVKEMISSFWSLIF